ncbi:hypothetical protein DFS34DRAFT_632408 [Phlyctochytrium arcticum]|nr:hypothetical protein DFS34DRAFT_632408 [Phlyctochytrium arcticum]
MMSSTETSTGTLRLVENSGDLHSGAGKFVAKTATAKTTTTSKSTQYPQYPLKALERLFSLNNSVTIIAHAAQIYGDIDALIAELPRAYRELAARHPKVRSKVSQPGFEATVYERFPEDQVQQQITVSVRSSPDEWQSLCRTRCNDVPTDSTQRFPVAVHVLRSSSKGSGNPSSGESAHLIVFSDHWASDGFSGYRMLHDLLQAAARNPSSTAALEPLPLLPSSVDLAGTKPMSNNPGLLFKLVSHFVGKQMRKFRSVFPIRTDIPDIKSPLAASRSEFSFASGTPENLTANLAKCRQESVTLFGALSAALVAAFSRVPGARKKSKVAFGYDFDFNLRPRLKPSLGQDHVGCLPGIGTFDQYAAGIDPTERFWDHARKSKGWTNKIIQSKNPLRFAEFIHHNTQTEEQVARTGETLVKGVVSDLNFSNLARYPFPTTHTFPSSSAIEIESVHLVNNAPGLCNAVILFITSVNHLDYSLSYKCTDEAGQAWFANVVKVIEAIHTVGKEETIEQVANRVLGELAQS